MDCYRLGVDFGGHVVVLGGGQTGCETAEHIARTGSAVTWVAKYDKLCPDAYRLHGIKLRSLLKEHGCTVIYNSVCVGVDESGVTVQNRTTGETSYIEADCIVNAIGMTAPASGIVENFCPGIPVTRIGDCVKARSIAEAMEEGYRAATLI